MALVVSHLFPSEMWAYRSTLMRFPVGEMGQGCPRPGTSNLVQAKMKSIKINHETMFIEGSFCRKETKSLMVQLHIDYM